MILFIPLMLENKKLKYHIDMVLMKNVYAN